MNNHIDFDGEFEKCRVTDLFTSVTEEPEKGINQFSSWIIDNKIRHFSSNVQNKSNDNIGFVHINIDGKKKVIVVTNTTNRSRNLACEQMAKTNSYQNGDIIFDLEEHDKTNPTPLLTKLVRFIADCENR